MLHEFKKNYGDIILKPLEWKNIEELRNLRNKEENRKCFIYQKEITKEEQENWYKKYLEKEEDIMFSAFLKADEEYLIGFAAFYDIDKNSKKCEFGRIIVDKNKVTKKGIGYQITKCLCDIGFQNLGLDMIYLEVFSDNIPALKTYEKAGFIERNRYKKNDKEIIYMELYK